MWLGTLRRRNAALTTSRKRRLRSSFFFALRWARGPGFRALFWALSDRRSSAQMPRETTAATRPINVCVSLIAAVRRCGERCNLKGNALRMRSEVAHDGVSFAVSSDWREAGDRRRWTRHQPDEELPHATGSTTPDAPHGPAYITRYAASYVMPYAGESAARTDTARSRQIVSRRHPQTRTRRMASPATRCAAIG